MVSIMQSKFQPWISQIMAKRGVIVQHIFLEHPKGRIQSSVIALL